MTEEQNDALSEELDPSKEGERPTESEPNPTQQRIDEETESTPHEGEEDTEIV